MGWWWGCVFGIMGGMLGVERLDRKLLDTMSVCGDLVPVGSVYRFLAEHRRAVFPDGMFADLYGGRGRPSSRVGSGHRVGVAGVGGFIGSGSDRPVACVIFVGRPRRGWGWLIHLGFHPTVLTLWRARLRNSTAPERVFDAVRTVVAESGVLSGRNKRVLGLHGVGRLLRGHPGHCDHDHSPDS